MARPYVFPDPKDRSPNAPTIIANATQVLGNYNQEHRDVPEGTRAKVTDVVKKWFKDQALEQGWATAEFHGSECLLTANIEIK